MPSQPGRVDTVKQLAKFDKVLAGIAKNPGAALKEDFDESLPRPFVKIGSSYDVVVAKHVKVKLQTTLTSC